MAITAGTYTFGAGGTYASLGAAWADLGNPLTGDLTLVQVGASADAGQIGTDAVCYNVATGRTLKITSALDPQMNPNGGYLLTFGGWVVNAFNGGLVWLDKLNYRGRVYMESTLSRGVNQKVTNSIGITSDVAFSALEMGNLGQDQSPYGIVTYEACNLKLQGADPGGLQINDQILNNNAYQNVYIENVAAITTGASSPILISSRILGQFNDFLIRNCVAMVANPAGGAIPIRFNGPSASAKTYYQSRILTCARNGGNADGAPYSYGAITSPADIISLITSDNQWLSTYGGSPLFSNGSAPSLADNPYNIAPYPIGVPGPSLPPPSASAQLIPIFVPGF